MRLINVRPPCTINNAANIPSGNTKSISNGLMRMARFGEHSDHFYSVVSNGRSMMFFAFLASMSRHIRHVRVMRIPPQIISMIVTGISIYVASLLLCATRAYECLKHKMMNISLLPSAKRDHIAIVVSGWRSASARLKLSPISAKSPFATMTRPYGSIGADPIAGMIANFFIGYCHVSNVYQGPVKEQI